MAAKKKETSVRIYVGAKRKCGFILFANGGGCAPPQPPPLFKGHRWLQKKNKRQDLCFALKEILKAIDGCKEKRTSVRIYVGAKEKAVRDHFVCNWGGGCAPPPNPPRFLKAIDGCKKKEQAVRIYVGAKRNP